MGAPRHPHPDGRTDQIRVDMRCPACGGLMGAGFEVTLMLIDTSRRSA